MYRRRVRSPNLATAIAVCALSLACATAGASASGAASSSLSTSCPGTFQVLNNDHVGTLSLPAGPYVIKIAGKLSCSQASSLLTTFLDQPTGALPDNWAITKTGFRRGPASFSVTRTAKKTPADGGNNRPIPTSLTCPGQFSVLHDDKIGAASFPQANYVISLLKKSSKLGCQDATRQFSLFLGTYSSGKLPKPWKLDAASKTFRTSGGLGFRVTQVGAVTGTPSGSAPTGGGGETQGTLCAQTYTAGPNERIDNFVLDQGTYQIWSVDGLACSSALTDVERVVTLRTSLPHGWRHQVQTSIITVGKGGEGFRLKLPEDAVS